METDRTPEEGADGANRTDSAAAAAAHPLAATFATYDLNGDGVLDEQELGEMLLALGFKADPEYVRQMVEAFGSFDTNNDGMLDVNEFQPLWEHIGGSETLHDAGAEEELSGGRARTSTVDLQASVSHETRANPLYSRFLEFDQNNKGWLSQFDVAQMMARLGFKAEPDYLAKLMELFGTFDESGDDRLSFEEFVQLWDHLGGEDAYDKQQSPSDDQKVQCLPSLPARLFVLLLCFEGLASSLTALRALCAPCAFFFCAVFIHIRCVRN